MFQSAMVQPGAVLTQRTGAVPTMIVAQQPAMMMPQVRSAAHGQPSSMTSPAARLDDLSYGGPGTDLATMPNMGDMQLAKLEPKKSVIHVCGRTVLLPDGLTRITDLQAVLQAELGMRDQIFEIFDLQGKRLILDTDVTEAFVDGRVPLTANLCDSSIHFIENRREELAQMQWKLVRDQHNQASLKLSQMTRQVSTVESSMENLQRETAMSMDRLRSEMQTAIEGAKGEARAESRQLGERVAGVSQHVTAERNMREVSIQQFNKALQGVRDTIDSDRTTVQQGVQLAMSQLSQTREMIDSERSAREAFEYRHTQDMQSANDRMDEMAASLKNVMAEYGRRFEKASQEATEVIESHGRTALKTRSEVETASSEVTARLNLMEERCATLEQRMLEAQQRQNDTMQRINHKNEKFNMSVEQLKFDGGQQSSNVTSIATKLQDVEASAKTVEQELREVHERERRQQQDEMRSTREAIVSEYGRKLELLENKLSARIEREGEARQETMTLTIENVNAVLKGQGVREIPVPRPRQIIQTSIRATPQTVVQGGSATVPRLMPADGTGSVGTAAVRARTGSVGTVRTPTGSTIVMPGQGGRTPTGSTLVVPGQAPGFMMVQPGATAPGVVTMQPRPAVTPTGSGLVMPMQPAVTPTGSGLVMPPQAGVQRLVSGGTISEPVQRIVSGGTRVR